MKTFDVLYARNSNGSINEWKLSVEILADNTALTHIEEGVLGGKLTETVRATKKGKNLNKMNATTAYEQACNEAQSRWEKKKKQGYKSMLDLGYTYISDMVYKETVNPHYTHYFTNESLQAMIEIALPKDRTDANNISKPMKAQPYFKDNGDVRIKFPCFGQPKLNGFRVMARWEKVMEGEGIFAAEVEKVVFRSKEGLRYDILEHIETQMTEEMFRPSDGSPERALDGEMYIHGEILSEISSAVKKRNAKTPLLKFCMFDCAVEGIKQNERIEDLEIMIDFIEANELTSLNIVETIIIKDNEHAQRFTDECIKRGYEGAIFRDMKAEYQFGKRPQTMVKLKRSQDKEFKIVDVVGGDNSPELGVFVCLAENGQTFKCTPEGSHDIKKEYLSNKANYIGKMLTVRFFERTKDDLPFHAVGVAVRDYE